MGNHIFQGQVKCFSSWKELLLLAWMWEDKDKIMLRSCKHGEKLSTDNVFDMLLKKKNTFCPKVVLHFCHLQSKKEMKCRKRGHSQTSTKVPPPKKRKWKPFICASSRVFVQMIHTSKPAQGKVVGSCQFHGVWRMPSAIRFFFLQHRLAAMVLSATFPGPWVTSPSQHINTSVERFHLTTEMGPPFPASKLLSRFKGVDPWTGKSSLSEKSIKANSCVSGSAKQPCNTHMCTLMHIICHQKVLGAAQLQPQT